jgi:site-specific DNA recombinase
VINLTLRAGEVLCSLVKEIVLTPEAGELRIDVRGDLAGISAIFLKTKTPAAGTGVSQFEMVAGIGFEPMTFRL